MSVDIATLKANQPFVSGRTLLEVVEAEKGSDLHKALVLWDASAAATAALYVYEDAEGDLPEGLIEALQLVAHMEVERT